MTDVQYIHTEAQGRHAKREETSIKIHARRDTVSMIQVRQKDVSYQRDLQKVDHRVQTLNSAQMWSVFIQQSQFSLRR